MSNYDRPIRYRLKPYVAVILKALAFVAVCLGTLAATLGPWAVATAAGHPYIADAFLAAFVTIAFIIFCAIVWPTLSQRPETSAPEWGAREE